ncbi:hypothetical protein GN956_G19006 [Arapaima gigas]
MAGSKEQKFFVGFLETRSERCRNEAGHDPRSRARPPGGGPAQPGPRSSAGRRPDTQSPTLGGPRFEPPERVPLSPVAPPEESA